MLWVALFAVSVLAQCPKKCTLHTDCPSTDPNITNCCSVGLCYPAQLLDDGASCTVGRSQTQVCADTTSGGGSCAYRISSSSLLSSDTQGRNHPSDEMCIAGQCRLVVKEPFVGDASCSCTTDTQCDGNSICSTVTDQCVTRKSVGENCVDSRQCQDNPVCSGGKCQALPVNATCTTYCNSHCHNDACFPNQCLYGSGKCGTPLPLGSPCVYGTDSCAVPYWCSGGFCKSYVDAGERCDAFIANSYPACKRGLVCDQSANPTICIQAFSKQANALCSNDNECVSNACIANQCFGGTLAGKFCNGTSDCGNDYYCDCTVNQCKITDTSAPCYTAGRAFLDALVYSLFGGVEPPDNNTLASIVLDFYCCYGCTYPGSNIGPVNFDCTARKPNGFPLNPCSGKPQSVFTGCAGWQPMAPTAPTGPTAPAPTPFPTGSRAPTPAPPPTPPTVPPPPTTRFPTKALTDGKGSGAASVSLGIGLLVSLAVL